MATSGRGTGVVGYNVQTAVDREHVTRATALRRLSCQTLGAMNTIAVPVVFGVLVAGAFQAYVSVRMSRSPAYTERQKRLQLLLIWLLPALGATLVYLVMRTDSVPSRARDATFTRDDGGIGPGDGHGDSSH